MTTLGQEYLQTVIRRLKYYKELGDTTISRLDNAQLHFRENGTVNSIAMIVNHMSGNMLSRWTRFLSEDGEKEWRQRDAEFEENDMDKAAIMATWDKGWQCMFDTLESLTENDLLTTVTIRKEPLSVIDAINRQLAHYPYHVGQIVQVGKVQLDAGWQSLSVPKGGSTQFNSSSGPKDPAKKY